MSALIKNKNGYGECLCNNDIVSKKINNSIISFNIQSVVTIPQLSHECLLWLLQLDQSSIWINSLHSIVISLLYLSLKLSPIIF